MNKVVGLLVLLGIVGIALFSYNDVYLSANTTGWSSFLTNIMGNAFPLLVGGVAVFLVVGLLMFNKKR